GSIHRLRWGDGNGDNRLELVVAPIFGRDAKPPEYAAPARLVVLESGGKLDPGTWKSNDLASRLVLHSIEVIDADGDGGSDILTADNGGVMLLRNLSNASVELISGATGAAPKRGSSEVHLGQLADGRKFLATIDPWHGKEVAVCVTERRQSAHAT